MPRHLKDPNEPKMELNEQQKAQLDKARAAGAVKRQENALIKKAAKQEEKEQAQKERQEKLLAAKNKLNGTNKSSIQPEKPVEQIVDEVVKKPEENNIKPEQPKPEQPKPEPQVEKPVTKSIEKPIEKIPKKSNKDAYYEYKLKLLQENKIEKKSDYNPHIDAHTIAKNNLHSHFSKEIMRDMWLANFGENERMPDKYL